MGLIVLSAGGGCMLMRRGSIEGTGVAKAKEYRCVNCGGRTYKLRESGLCRDCQSVFDRGGDLGTVRSAFGLRFAEKEPRDRHETECEYEDMVRWLLNDYPSKPVGSDRKRMTRHKKPTRR